MTDSPTFPPSVVYRPLSADDIPDAMRLTRIAGWNQTPADWERFLAASPDGCFAAEQRGRVIGTSATIVHSGEVAWVGMVLVDPHHRGSGIGTELLRRAIAYLDERGVPCIRLDATPLGRPIYERSGFVDEYRVERWVLQREEPAPSAALAQGDDLDEVLGLDREVFGADRGDLLRSVAAAAPDLVRLVREGDRIAGYSLGRRGARADHLGPWVARDETTAATLLDDFLARSARDTVFVDAVTPNPWAVGLLESRGFEFTRPLTRMARGSPAPPNRTDLMGAILGPEFG